MMTKVFYKKSMPSFRELGRATRGKNFILLYDERLNGHPVFKIWANSFTHKFGFFAGEKLKDLDAWPMHVKKILPALAGFSRRENVIVSVGGGSLGDFSGFMASVLKRGVGYVHIPSTWLAAVDSAYGGKNGLNVEDLKNQVGTFYEPQFVFCVRELLLAQHPENLRSALGEVFKVVLLHGRKMYAKLLQGQTLDEAGLWRLLPQIVQAKYDIVKRDPFETKGIRELLNLGHTLGHALETEHALAHGVAIQQGLEFALEWSYRRKVLSQKNYSEIKGFLQQNRSGEILPVPFARLQRRIQQDKKALSGNKIKFVFLKGPGKAVIEEVKIEDFMIAATDFGWAR